MRQLVRSGDFSVHAISGTHCVLLGMDATKAACANLKGFAIGIQPDSGPVKWLRGFKFFKSIVPNPQPGERRPTNEHPIQDFVWGDYAAWPDREYRYVIRPLFGAPGSLQAGPELEVKIRTEPTDRGGHAIFFNRGAIPSQKFADQFGNRGPADENDPGAADVRWLSRGLLEGALAFIGQARGASFELRVAAYEFSYRPILDALLQAAGSGVKVKIIYEAGQIKEKGQLVDTSTTVGNREAIQAMGLATKPNITLIKRTKRAAIPHNKFIVLLDNGHPIEVWTGSTNFTASGFLGQSNVGHWVRHEATAQSYSAFWEALLPDPVAKDLKAWCSLHTPNLGAGLPPSGITPLFSPRKDSKMLAWYGEQLEGAKQVIMFTAAFGVTEKLGVHFDNDRDFLRQLLMEKKASDKVQPMLERDYDTQLALGTALNKEAISLGLDGHRLDEWFKKEEHFRKKGHIFYVHTKIMMIDPLTSDPLVFSGSANFSPNSLLSNDENMLLIRGDTGVADIYATEFKRLFNHFYFRYIATKTAQEKKNKPSKVAYLDETDGWVRRYFDPKKPSCKERLLFRGS
ncbi:MAG: phospholipase D-like domain-containing protein [Anaerolineales bacterium]